jgi:hypothetical protein
MQPQKKERPKGLSYKSKKEKLLAIFIESSFYDDRDDGASCAYGWQSSCAFSSFHMA